MDSGSTGCFKMIFVFLLLFVLLAARMKTSMGVVWKIIPEGEQCFHRSGSSGTCVTIRNCPAALDDIKNRRVPQTCGFSGYDMIVCCVGSSAPPPAPPPTNTPRPRPQATKTPPRPGSMTEYTPAVNGHEDYDSETSTSSCKPIDRALTASKTGRKAWDKCIEYQEKYVYPCEPSKVLLTGESTRGNHCMHNAEELIIQGGDAFSGEFPHMALLGFGSDLSAVEWLCGGTIISDKYIMTAGHCTFSRDNGPVTYAMIGILKRSDEVDSTKVYRIQNIIKHPDYKPPLKYNDIALLETENKMKLGPYAVPACLPAGGPVRDERAFATGWARAQFLGGACDTLQKMILSKFTNEECSARYPATRHTKRGFDSSSQMCFGYKTMSKDTCQCDSGGPLQINNPQIHCMYTVIGVNSFGKGCGYVVNPGVFTRVEKYTPWVESVVWPDQ